MRLVNHLGQPVGRDLTWKPPPYPTPVTLPGRTVSLEPLSWSAHGRGLHAALADAPEELWTYMAFGPFSEVSDFRDTIEEICSHPDWVPFAFMVEGEPLGFASYLRIQPRDGVIEIGSIVLSPVLQRSTPATEAIYLMLRHVFELGYRRCEWKCDDLNEASRAAAGRFGFIYEGTFRNATHYKGRNRDTAWYSIIDRDWPVNDRALKEWLSPENFDPDGSQVRALREVRDS